jgi:hypothetical protein
MAVALELDPGDYSGTYTPVLLDQVAEPPAQADAAPVEVGEVNEPGRARRRPGRVEPCPGPFDGTSKDHEEMRRRLPRLRAIPPPWPRPPAAAAISDARQGAAP